MIDKIKMGGLDTDEVFAGVIPVRIFRGIGWLLFALLGAFLLARYVGMTEYWQRWAGACFKVATGGWIGFRISRDICRIDPSVATSDIRAAAMLQLARALIVGCTILALCLAV
jgi:hypothetical protein